MKITTGLLTLALALASASATAVPAAVAFRNDLPGTYQLERVRCWVDGVLVYDAPRPFEAALRPGDHVVSVAADYRMHDPVLSYVNGYRFELRSAERVRAPVAHVVIARAVESGGVTTPIDRRARIVWR